MGRDQQLALSRVGLLLLGVAGMACDSDRLVLCSPTGAIGTQKAAIVGGAPRAEYLALGAAAESAIVHLEFSAFGRALGFCTGVVIGEGWALSAAHCLAGKEASTVALSFGASAAAPEQTVEANVVAIHPTLDLLLLAFKTPTGTANASLKIATRSPAVGSLAQLAGFGLDESGQIGKRRFVAEEIAKIDVDSITVTGARRSGACTGDSGGPLMVRDMDGSPAVAGILGAGAVTCVATDHYTRADLAQTWLESYVGNVDIDTGCGSLDSVGACYDGVAVWCDGEVRSSVMCAAPFSCGWDRLSAGFRCVEPALDPCQGVSVWGECQGHTLLRCDEGDLRVDRCLECGADCRRLPTTGAVACATEAALDLSSEADRPLL